MSAWLYVYYGRHTSLPGDGDDNQDTDSCAVLLFAYMIAIPVSASEELHVPMTIYKTEGKVKHSRPRQQRNSRPTSLSVQ